MNKEELLNDIKQAFIENEDLRSIVMDINSYDGYFDDMQWWDNDEEFFETFFGTAIMDAVRAVCYGEYNYTDEYVKINADGNLETTNYIQDELEGYVDDIVEHIIDNWSELNNIDVSQETKDMIEEYINMEG